MQRPELAIVLSGGGARAAYQVGFLRFLASRFPDIAPGILTGVSAGAVNAAYLAAHVGTFRDKVERLARLWAGLQIEQVFRTDPRTLVLNVTRWGMRLLSGGRRTAPYPRSLVDTAPLQALLARVLDARDDRLPGVAHNLERGLLKSIAITASSYTTGQSITWVQGCEICGWERAHRKSVSAPIGVAHVMASSALPIFFPAVRVGDAWYGDGGIRLTAPLSPAIHLGADRIIAISTRYGRSREEADQPVVDGYPPPAQVAGVLLNAIFLDLLDNDVLRMQRINALVEGLPEDRRGGLRRVSCLVLRPSQDLGRLAVRFEARLPRAFRFLTRGLGAPEARSNDLLSLVMFQSDYLNHLLELGEADARARADDIVRFLEPSAAAVAADA